MIDGADHLFEGKTPGSRRGARGSARRLRRLDHAMKRSRHRFRGADRRSARRRTARSGTTRPDDMAAAVIDAALRARARLRPRRGRGRDPRLRDAGGRAGPERRADRQPARGRSRLGVGGHVNRFCSSGLQSIAFAAERIMAGFATAIVAGGTESMSLVPMGGHKPSPNPALVDSYPDVYLTTGLVAENHARDHAISPRRAGRVRAAQPSARGRRDRRRPVRRRDRHGPARLRAARASTKGRAATRRSRRSASCEPAFHVNGTVTAGNSSQMSDGAAAVLVMEETAGPRARPDAARPLRRLRHRRRRARALRHRSGARDPEGAEAWPGSRSTRSI